MKVINKNKNQDKQAIEDLHSIATQLPYILDELQKLNVVMFGIYKELQHSSCDYDDAEGDG